MKAQAALAAVIWLVCSVLPAGISDYYSFYAGTTNYTEITGTTVAEAQGHDVISGPIELGFSFTYGVNAYTQVKISSNGYITLGTAPGSTPANNLASSSYCPVIAALWDDLHTGLVADSTTSSVQYLLWGNSPNRTFIVQYKNAYWDAASTTGWVNFQIVLKEYGIIQFKYGANSGTGPGTSASASIGINMLPGGVGNFLSVNPSASTASAAVETNNINTCIPFNTMYGFNLAAGPANDLSAVSITGPMLPSVGAPATYTVSIRNRGSSPQAAYAVKLMSGATELASAAGPAIQPQATVQVQLSWTPAVTGAMQIYGKAALAGDQNANNDQTQPINITVMPEGTISITIGDGSQNARLPVDMYYRNSLFETIFQAAEIPAVGLLTVIRFYNNFSDMVNLNKPVKVWLGITDQTDLSSGWIPSTQLILVFDGNVLFPSGQNEIIIPLQIPFPYTGGNLVMLVNRPQDSQYFSSFDFFKSQTAVENRSRILHSNYLFYDPAAPEEPGTLDGQFPQTSFSFSPNAPDPQFAISPLSAGFGQNLINTVSDINFTVINTGGGTVPLTINSITFSGSPCFTLQNLPTLPLAINAMGMTTFTLRYSPTEGGTHSGTFTVTDNLTRTQHFVEVSGTCFDPQIYTLPYVQNFDSVTIPDLPPDWFKLISPFNPDTDVITDDYDCHSLPNSVIFSGDTNAFLIAPPLAPALNINDMRVKFWTRGSGTLGVGVIADMNDAATYTQISTISLTSDWTEHIVTLAAYTGGGRFVAFQFNGGWYYYDYIDDVTIENSPVNDLAAVSLSGNVTPSVSTPTEFTVNLFNWGTIPQSNYTVSLCDSSGLQLAFATGPEIEPGLTAQAAVSWTPAVEGPLTVYGKVILDGDENSYNDKTPGLSLAVQPQGTIAITVGDGSQTSYYCPVNMYYQASLYENIYFSEDITAGGLITALGFYNNFTSDLSGMPTKVWLGLTGQSDLSAGWISSDELVQVFDGAVDYPDGQNTIIIPLDVPFPYYGGNLAMLVQRPLDLVYYNWYDTFYCQTVGTDHARYVYGGDVEYNPATVNGGTLTGLFPKTTFFFSAAAAEPVFSIVPAGYDFGQVMLNTDSDQSFRITNSGGGTDPLVISDISINDSPYFTLQNPPALPIALASGESIIFTVRYSPSIVGAHTATLNITDTLARTYAYSSISSCNEEVNRSLHTVSLTGVCFDPVIHALPYAQNFDAVTLPFLPAGWTAKIVTSGSVESFSTTMPHSQPYCARIFNTSIAEGPYLIAPPLDSAIPVNTVEVTFWAKCGGPPVTMTVGVMTDPNDATTFVQTAVLTPTTAWVEYTIRFHAYAGSGRYIAFTHGVTGYYQRVYIDDVSIEAIPANDLAAVSLTGSNLVYMGETNNYTVTLYNWGLMPQSDYTVKLYEEGGSELASVSGTAISPGGNVEAVIPWIPAVQGELNIFAQVILATDQDSLNNRTPSLHVVGYPAGTFEMTIGDGSQTSYYAPVNMYYKSSLFENIYMRSECSANGLITGISFYNNFTINLPDKATKIWLGTTAQTNLSSGWIPSTSLTLVFDGLVDYPVGQNLINILLTQPFAYLQDNLVMLVQRPLDNNYYSSSNVFYCQTVGNNRARRIYSDTVDYDPATITGGTVTGQFPKTSFFFIPSGVGHLSGTVYGNGNLPLNNTIVQVIGGGQATTNAEGHFLIQLIAAGEHQVSASRNGYYPQTVTVNIPAGSTVLQNYSLAQMPTVTVTGTITGSDAPEVGLAGAAIAVTGYETYNITANALGQFTIPGVYTNQTYQYIASAAGYQDLPGTLTVGDTNYNMGTIILTEMAYFPLSVAAEIAAGDQAVDISWLAPDPGYTDIFQSFENGPLTSFGWTQIITDGNPANEYGVYPTWCRVGTVTAGTTTITPTDGLWQCGFWWDDVHQDEWLISPRFLCRQNALLTFDTYTSYYAWEDHYYVKVSCDDGSTWTVLWDASALYGDGNYYQFPVQISLAAYAGQQVRLAWHGDDDYLNYIMFHAWFIDNIVISNAETTIRIPEASLTTRSEGREADKPETVVSSLPFSRSGDSKPLSQQNPPDSGLNHTEIRDQSRALAGYRVWRLTQGQEQDETAWTLLTPGLITALALTDDDWPYIPEGIYKWAVKAIYTNDVSSQSAFSNALFKPAGVTGTLEGAVRDVNNLPVADAVIAAGAFTTTAGITGSYSMPVNVGTYCVTCSAPGFQTMTNENVVITEGQTSICDFILPVSTVDEAAVARTVLIGNYPNPFNPETSILFDIKEVVPVRIEIYNIKGQLIRNLVNTTLKKGHHQFVWNGKDNHGNQVAGGVYCCRMQAGAVKSSRLMVLMK
jgi:hypothetical protein